MDQTSGGVARCVESRPMCPPSHTVSGSAADADEVNPGLAVARNLARIYVEVLETPVPEAVQYLICRWEAGGEREGGKSSMADLGDCFRRYLSRGQPRTAEFAGAHHGFVDKCLYENKLLFWPSL